ncbi:MAG: DUF308 domain-containing protein [Paramuribaculum sp.]|nr:DUF308 domain-containing protein [Paramuribaculum sp.]
MNGKSWLSILVTAIVGVLLIVFHNRGEILSWVVVLFGVCLVLPAMYNLFAAFRMSRQLRLAQHSGYAVRRMPTGSMMAAVLANVACIALGVWMLVSPGFFAGFIVYLFGSLLLFYGIYELVWAIWMSKPFRVPFYYYFVPALMMAGGIVILFTSVRTMNNVMMLVTGIMLVASSVNSAMELVSMHPAKLRGQTGV